jgi:hypothetical protein
VKKELVRLMDPKRIDTEQSRQAARQRQEELNPVLVSLTALSRTILEVTHPAACLEAVANYITATLGLPCLITGPEGRHYESHPSPDASASSVSDLVLPIVEGGETLGTLRCQLPSGGISPAEYHLLDLLVGLAALKLRTFLPPPPVLTPSQILIELQNEDTYPIAADSRLSRAAVKLGIDLSEPHIALMVEGEGESPNTKEMEATAKTLSEDLMASDPMILWHLSPASSTEVKSIIGLIRLRSPSQSALLDTLRGFTTMHHKPPLTIGVGGVVGEQVGGRLTSFKGSFEQAKKALSLKRELNLPGSSRVFSISDVRTVDYLGLLPENREQTTVRITEDVHRRILPYSRNRTLSTLVCHIALTLTLSDLIVVKGQSGRRTIDLEKKLGRSVSIQVTQSVKDHAINLGCDETDLLRTAIHQLAYHPDRW